MQERLIDSFKRTISAYRLSNGTPLYHLHHASILNLEDESGYSAHIWKGNMPNEETEEEYYALDLTLAQILNNMNPDGDWKKIHGEDHDSTKTIWTTEAGDMIHLHYADNSIHLYTFDSGQY